MGKVEEIAAEIEAHCIRVDIDDSASTLQKKIREAEQEWVPYIVVVGEKKLNQAAYRFAFAKKRASKVTSPQMS